MVLILCLLIVKRTVVIFSLFCFRISYIGHDGDTRGPVIVQRWFNLLLGEEWFIVDS